MASKLLLFQLDRHRIKNLERKFPFQGFMQNRNFINIRNQYFDVIALQVWSNNLA